MRMPKFDPKTVHNFTTLHNCEVLHKLQTTHTLTIHISKNQPISRNFFPSQ